MDEEMGEAIEGDQWHGFDIDFDYEYDAPKYFDLSGEEPPMEASSAEKWFQTAQSYPPSPLIMKIICEKDIFSQDVIDNSDTGAQLNPSESDDLMKEDEHCRVIEDVEKVALKPRVKNFSSKVSTLMKPTASYLAKKTQRCDMNSLIRNNKFNSFKSLESSGELKDCTVQATKRQRLEKGHLRKAPSTAQPDLIHKTPNKTDGHANGNLGHARTRVTIPREPVLQTMRRAERFRARRGLINDNEAQEQNMQPRTTLKVHASNRNEFNLTNQSRAHGDSSGVASKVVQGYDRVSRRPEHSNSQNCRLNRCNPKQEWRNSIFLFKAGTPDRKVAPSNGNVVIISRNAKRQTNEPEENKLHTRRQQKPPPLTEVFNKLSITREAQHLSTSKTPLVPSSQGSKDSKENRRINNFRY